MKRLKCPYCKNYVEVQDLGSCWICPICKKYFTEKQSTREGNDKTKIV